MAKLNDNQQKVLDLVSEMSVLELADLVSEMEEKFGVSAAAPMAVAAAPAASGEPEEEKTTFNVVIADVGGNKINVIKAVREIAELGLKEAKDLVEKGAGTVVKEDATKDEAEAIKAKLEEAGAKVELK